MLRFHANSETLAALPNVLQAAARAPGNRSRFLAADLIDQSGLLVADWQSALARLPVLRKSAVRSQPGDFFVDALDVVYRGQTSGSEGQPLVYFAGDRWNQQRLQARKRLFEWWNIPDATPILNIASRLGPLRPQDASLVGPIDVELVTQLQQFAQAQPIVLRGYPSRLCAVAAACGENSISVVAVIATGECLFEFQRSWLEKIFQAPVINEYGAQESGISGFSCPEAGRLHLDTDRCLYEIINGELITTDLWNTTMPMVRYAVGDRLECFEDDCPCGRSGLTVKVLGRQTEVVHAYDQPRWVGELNLPIIDGIIGYHLIQSQPMQLQVDCIQPLKISDREKLQIWLYETLGLGATALVESLVQFPNPTVSQQPTPTSAQWLQQIFSQPWSSWINSPLPQDEAAAIAALLQQCVAPRRIGIGPALWEIHDLLDTPIAENRALEAMKIRTACWATGQSPSPNPILYQQILDRVNHWAALCSPDELTQSCSLGFDCLALLFVMRSDEAKTVWRQSIELIHHYWPVGIQVDAFTLYHYLDRLHQVKLKPEKSLWRPMAAVLVGDLWRIGSALDLGTVGLWLEMCHDLPGEFVVESSADSLQQVWIELRRSLLQSDESRAMRYLEKQFALAQTDVEKAHCYLEKGYAALVFGHEFDPRSWQPILRQYLGLLTPASQTVNPLPWMPILRSAAPALMAINPQLAYACLVAAAPPNHWQGNFDRQTQQVNQKQSLLRSGGEP